jgi:hypothetical protein
MSTESNRVRIAKIEGRKECPVHLSLECCGKGPLPKYHESIDAIQRAVLAQDEEFKAFFEEGLLLASYRKHTRLHQLTAADWCDCFCAVLDERSGKP